MPKNLCYICGAVIPYKPGRKPQRTCGHSCSNSIIKPPTRDNRTQRQVDHLNPYPKQRRERVAVAPPTQSDVDETVAQYLASGGTITELSYAGELRTPALLSSEDNEGWRSARDYLKHELGVEEPLTSILNTNNKR